MSLDPDHLVYERDSAPGFPRSRAARIQPAHSHAQVVTKHQFEGNPRHAIVHANFWTCIEGPVQDVRAWLIGAIADIDQQLVIGQGPNIDTSREGT